MVSAVDSLLAQAEKQLGIPPLTDPVDDAAASEGEQAAEAAEEEAAKAADTDEWFRGQPSSNVNDAEIAGWFRQQPTDAANGFRGQPTDAADGATGDWFREQPSSNADDGEIAGWFRQQPCTPKEEPDSSSATTVDPTALLDSLLARAEAQLGFPLLSDSPILAAPTLQPGAALTERQEPEPPFQFGASPGHNNTAAPDSTGEFQFAAPIGAPVFAADEDEATEAAPVAADVAGALQLQPASIVQPADVQVSAPCVCTHQLVGEMVVGRDAVVPIVSHTRTIPQHQQLQCYRMHLLLYQLPFRHRICNHRVCSHRAYSHQAGSHQACNH